MSAHRRKVKCCYCQQAQPVEIPSTSCSAQVTCAGCGRTFRALLDMRDDRTSDLELSQAARAHYAKRGGVA